ncbi:entericidin A/B family lipoprotein [Beggiatoa leptomitoformis]|uniref:Entericidin A/B family lipoprotein n=1 Tax=Beggiatoa leptomitoformis TaxID=288004 RepID=A0A2N9YIG7_9GAMM|nr:entericidin A/B family lipoprotein [Beggiatoa leptomitoformis]ALG67504.1 entericidin A/B family lipoprotein [Beggiatoa leptomitoformis]AUI70273.1 entericidin A/B family lipoprotein [Beggiatoa leptomitoformis]
MKKIIAAIAMLLMVSSLAACNTIAGAGKDVQEGGKAVEKAAK